MALEQAHEGANSPMFSGKVYDRLKWVTMIVLPALGTFYFAIAGVWGLPNPEAVVATNMALVTLLGVVLGVSTKAYNASDAPFDGVIEIAEDENGTKRFNLNLDGDPLELGDKPQVTFRVQNN